MSAINHPSEYSPHNADVPSAPPEAHQRANFYQAEQPPRVRAQRVGQRDRLMFLPNLLGTHFCRFETLVYLWMHRLAKEYTGGYWEFYELSNGGFYIALSEEIVFNVEWHGNCFQSLMSSEAASIVAQLFALGELFERTFDNRLICFSDHLKEFAVSHPEAQLIFAAIE